MLIINASASSLFPSTWLDGGPQTRNAPPVRRVNTPPLTPKNAIEPTTTQTKPIICSRFATNAPTTNAMPSTLSTSTYFDQLGSDSIAVTDVSPIQRIISINTTTGDAVCQRTARADRIIAIPIITTDAIANGRS